MLLKKDGEKSVKFSSRGAEILITNNSGIILADVTYDKGGMKVDKPGEYEFFDTGLMAYEFPNGDYLSQIDLVKIVHEDADVCVVFHEIDLDKRVSDKVGACDVLLTNNITFEYLKKLLACFSPTTLVLLATGSELLERIKKEFGEGNVKTDNKINLQVSEADVADARMEIYILNS